MFDIITALVTPFKEDGSIDYLAIHKLMNYLISKGNVHFVLCGTTGECSCLSMKEKIEYVHYMVQHFDQCQFIVGISTNCTKEAIYQMKQLSLVQGIEAWLVVTPYYNKPSQEGLFQHYDTIAKSTKKDIILYNVPSRTSINLETTTIVRLAKKHDNIIALKQAGEIDNFKTIKENIPDFLIYLGSDELLEEAIQLGFDGVISVASHLLYKEMLTASKGEEMNYEIYKKQVALLFKESSPAPVKCLLSQKRLVENKLRLPLVPVSLELAKELKQLFGSN